MGWRFVEASRTVCYAINGHWARFEIRADNSRFHNVLASIVPGLSRTETFAKVIGISCRDALSVRAGFRARFSRRAGSRLVWPFSIPVDSPRDKRGIVWSGNRGLRFGIGADNGRIPMTLTCLRQRTCYSWEWSMVYRGYLSGTYMLERDAPIPGVP